MRENTDDYLKKMQNYVTKTNYVCIIREGNDKNGKGTGENKRQRRSAAFILGKFEIVVVFLMQICFISETGKTKGETKSSDKGEDDE